MAQDPHTDLVMIIACEVSALDAGSAVPVLHGVSRLRGLLDSVGAAITNRLNELAEQGRSAPASDVLSRNTHVSAKKKRRGGNGAPRHSPRRKHSARRWRVAMSVSSMPMCSPT